MIRGIRSEWTIRDATFVEDGWTAIYRVTCRTPSGDRTCYLKATPEPDEPAGVDAEARLTEVVRTQTDIPAPQVLGAVDEHDDLRAPYFLMEAMPGTRHSTAALTALPDSAFRALGRQTGRYLGQLHALETPNLTRFGKGLTYSPARSLTGEPPDSDANELVFPDGYERWDDRLRDWMESDLEALTESDRFGDLVDPIEASLEVMLSNIPARPEAVIARVDQALWNLLTDETGHEITAMLDWGSLFVTPPAYDLAVCELFLAGGPWMGLETVGDRRPTIREGLLEGYREHRQVPTDYDRKRRCYQLETFILPLSVMGEPDDRDRRIPPDRVDDAEPGVRRIVRDLLR